MPQKNPEKFNVIFIFADQLGACYMGTYGHPQVQTPCFDLLAAQSVMFQRAYSASPLCTPFRGSLFTGLYPYQSGIVHNWQALPNGVPTLANHLKQAGYHTCFIGKWHLTENQNETYVPNDKRGGFDDFIGWDSGHSRHHNQKYFDSENEQIRIMHGHETDALTDIACERINRYAKTDTPFCMFIAYQSPHPFCSPTQPYYNIYKDKKTMYRPTVDHNAYFHGYGKDRELTSVKDWTERYFGEISQLDNQIGLLLQHIHKKNLDKNTIIIFTSDHGDMGGCHGLFEKNCSYEEAIHIPLMIRSPRQKGTLKTNNLFSSIDLFPTLLGLCSVPVPEDAAGFNHAHWLHGENNQWMRDDILIQLQEWSCMHDGNNKLTTNPECTEVISFHQLADDPFEQNNSKENPESQPQIQFMIERLRSHPAQQVLQTDNKFSIDNLH